MLEAIVLGQRALAANQYALNTIGHNIANANTKGYTRQKVVLTSGEPTTIPVGHKDRASGAIGTGVKVQEIRRLKNEFLAVQNRDIKSDYGYWSERHEKMNFMEGVFNEPSTSGINSNLNKFWDAWQSLSASPGESGRRSNLITQSTILVKNVREIRKQLVDLQQSTNDALKGVVDQVNEHAVAISNLNRQIVEGSSIRNPNDLMDKRDQHLEDLSKLIDFEYYKDEFGSVTVSIGGVFLVSNYTTNKMKVEIDNSNKNYYNIIWANNNDPAIAKKGKLEGFLVARDTDIQGCMDKLDITVKTLINEVNQQHRAGYDLKGEKGIDFFLGTDSSSFELNKEIFYDNSKIAASSTANNLSGNGENASSMAKVRNKGVLNSGVTTINEYFREWINNLGSDISEADTYKETYHSLEQQIEQDIMSISGVSLDEEMAELIKYEHSYAAVARYISVISTILETLMGLV